MWKLFATAEAGWFPTTARRKAKALCCSVATHILLLWALIPTTAKPQVESGAMSASLFDGDAFFSPQRAVSRLREAPRVERPLVEREVLPDIEPLPATELLPPVDVTAEPVEIGDAVSTQVAAAARAAAASDGEPCLVGAWLQSALQNEPLVQEALTAIPSSARSVANAVMLWNGRWSPAPNAALGMARIRALVVAGVASAPESCQLAPINGPVLITVGDPANSTVLAVGSGQWRWRDLLAESQQMQ